MDRFTLEIWVCILVHYNTTPRIYEPFYEVVNKVLADIEKKSTYLRPFYFNI